MKWAFSGALALGLMASWAMPASATTCGGPTGVFMNVTVSSGSVSCFASGNSYTLGTPSDPLASEVLDTTVIGDNRTPELHLNYAFLSATEGSFSFDPTGYHAFYVGFQLYDGILKSDSENPDWFIVGLSDPTTGQGTFDADIKFLGWTVPSDPVIYAVLYGLPGTGDAPSPGETPLPSAVWLLGSVLAGAAGLKKYRESKGLSLTPVAA